MGRLAWVVAYLVSGGAGSTYMTSFRGPSVGGNCSHRCHRSGTFAPAAAFADWCRSSCSTDRTRALIRNRPIRPDHSCSTRDPGDWCYRSADRDPCLQPSGKTRSYQTLDYYKSTVKDISVETFFDCRFLIRF